LSKQAIVEIGIGVAAIGASLLLPGSGAILMGTGAASGLFSSVFGAGASMLAGGIVGGIASLGMQTGGIVSAMRTPVGAHNFQFGYSSIGGTTVFETSNNNTGGGTTSQNKQLHLVRVLNAHPSAIGTFGTGTSSDWQLFVGGKPVQMEVNGPGYLSKSPTQLSIDITSISRSGGLVTIVLASPLANANGTTCFVKNVADKTYNCICILTQPNPADNTTFTYVCGGADGSSTGGVLGTAFEDVGGRVYVEFLDGNHTSTFATLLASGTQWGATDMWYGRTLMYLQLGYDASDFGSIPDIRLVCQGNNNIFDPRTNTFGFTNNAALCTAYYLNLPRSEGGFGIPYGTDTGINIPQLIAAANICDEPVTLAAGGTVPRYTCNGSIQVTKGRGTILNELLSCMAGRVSFSGGSYYIFPGAFVAPTASFTTTDFYSPKGSPAPVEFKVLLSSRDVANEAKGVFTSPANNWQEADIPAYTQDSLHGYETNQWLLQDNNEILTLVQNLPFTTDVATAQRLLKIFMMRTRFQYRVTVRLSMKAITVIPCDVITITHPRYGWNNETFEVLSATQVIDTQGGNPVMYMQLELALTDPSVYDWSTEEELSATGFFQPDNMGGTHTTAQPNNLTLYTGPGETAGGVTYPNTVNTTASGVATNSIFVTWDAPNDIFVTSGGAIEIQYQLSTVPTWTPAGKVTGDATQFFISPVTDGLSYNVQIRSVNVVGGFSDWVQAGPVLVSASQSELISTGLSPNIPANGTNNATIDSLVDGSAAEIRLYGPGGVGTPWTFFGGQGNVSEDAINFTGLDFSTVYYLVINTGGSVLIFEDYNLAQLDEYLPIGSIKTVASDGTGGITGGGGVGIPPRLPIQNEGA
jgi:Putative phage tail protein